LKVFRTELPLSKIREICAGEMLGAGVGSYTNVSELQTANEKSICFFENEKYRSAFSESNAGLILIPSELSDVSPKPHQTFIRVPKPYLFFMTLVSFWLSTDNLSNPSIISPTAIIDPTAQISDRVSIAPYAVISENVRLSEGVSIGAHCVILPNVSIGKYTRIYPHTTIYEDVSIGEKCIIHAGAVIGADGFGFLMENGYQHKIPQVGNVVIGDDVEIGANTCIDRSTIGTTHVKTNTKIDNLVQIGHNCHIAEHSILCSQVGLAGNSHIGKRVYLGGQVGVSGHLTIADDTMVGAQSGVANTLETGKYFGSPAISAFEQKKIYTALKDLPSVVKYIKKHKKNE
jgi:UDP-3-O-[3-hydroxymyristoyl] glucosamine N-acyltransferase